MSDKIEKSNQPYQNVLNQGYYSIPDELKECKPIVSEVQQALRFLSVLAITTTVASGVRTEGAEIDIPAELAGKKFKITDIYITAETSTSDQRAVGDNLLVGLILGGKSLLIGAKQTFNGITTTLDMLPVPAIRYCNTCKSTTCVVHYRLHSELFNNIKKLRIVYSNISNGTIHYLVYLTIGGVIL